MFVLNEVTDNAKSSKITLQIVKRDGRKVNFDDTKIYNALVKAEIALSGKNTPLRNQMIEQVVDVVVSEINNRFKDTIKNYEIQNIVWHTKKKKKGEPVQITGQTCK